MIDVFIPDVDCLACGEPATYWEVRATLPPHISITGFEVIEAGFDHPDGTTHTEW